MKNQMKYFIAAVFMLTALIVFTGCTDTDAGTSTPESNPYGSTFEPTSKSDDFGDIPDAASGLQTPSAYAPGETC